MKAKITSFLLWSQKYTKADMLYIFKNGSWVMFGQGVNSVLSLVLIVAFANLLPKETYGTYKYILSLAGLLNIFTLTGMNNAVARSVATGLEGILKPAVKYQLVWNSIMFFALTLLGSYYLFHGDQTLAISFFILGVFTPMTLAFNTYGAFLEGKKYFGTANILSTLSTLSYATGILIALLCSDSVTLLIGVYATATFLPSFVFYRYVVHKFKQTTTTAINDTLRYGRELTYLRIIDPIVSNIDKILLAHFWGPAQLATYTLALAIPNRATLFMKSWVAIGFPKFSEKTFSGINLVFWRRVIQGMIIGLITTTLYILVSPFIFHYVLPQYIEGIFYSQLLAISFIFAIPNRYISLLLTSQRLSKVLYKRTFIHSTTSISLYILGGIWGGILGLVVAHILIDLMGLTINIILWRSASKSS